MALNQDQWYAKLKNLVPSWVTRDEKTQAVFKAIAKTMADQQAVSEDHLKETYIQQGSDDYVALHGNERSVYRLTNEDLEPFRYRVTNIQNQCNFPAIKALVDSLLVRGECIIIEHYNQNNFLDRGGYLNRLIIDFQVLYNAFTILIDDQTPDPKSFYDRGFFADREDVYGSAAGDNNEVFQNIVAAVNKNKAFGTVYRLIERAPS